MVEDCNIAFTPDLIHVFGMIILNYIFNLPYAAPTQPTTVFIQKVIHNLADDYKAPTTVLNLIAKSRRK